jgi:hypothetical protein
VAESIGDGRVYFNTGTWLPLMRPGLLRSFTHVIIQHSASGPTAGLYQWRDGASRAFTPGWVPLLAQARARRASEPRAAELGASSSQTAA